MTKVLESYNSVVQNLEPILCNLPGRVIAIDGKDGSGKTTLGRFLAWTFNITLIETDLFIKPKSVVLEYDEEIILHIINFRLNKPRPVIIEGIAIRNLLNELKVKPDFVIYIENEAYSGSHGLSKILSKYEEDYMPKQNANLVIKVDIV